MGTAAYRGKGFKEFTRVSSQRPVGAASFRQQSTQASCQPSAPLPRNFLTGPVSRLTRVLVTGLLRGWGVLESRLQPASPCK